VDDPVRIAQEWDALLPENGRQLAGPGVPVIVIAQRRKGAVTGTDAGHLLDALREIGD